ncbi:hypothetical protein [Edaphobacter aggregans]|uniref:hypothetical protein n=1 Tax=Edaphobacter aggregans TaxID=570835 RepID=UPI000AB8A5FF|nr:hypothetical protein [Edaphobacter aggregans]
MSTQSSFASTPATLYSLLPAVFRTRDAMQGQPLEAFFAVLEEQYGIVRENLEQLYNDQFIETCAPWAIPYLGELIGFNQIYTLAENGVDSRAEVANTIGYRRRKGTLLAMEQLTHDVSGRPTIAVEEFRRLITNLSLKDVRPHHRDTVDIRSLKLPEELEGPFTRLNRTIDVRRIAPPIIAAVSPDTTPLDKILHGGGRFNIPDVAIWMWRYCNRTIENAPAFSLGSGGYFFSLLGGPVKLFQKPRVETAPFTRLFAEADAPEPILRRAFAEHLDSFYPSSMSLIADGATVDRSQIVCANLTENSSGGVCRVPSGKIAIDPETGRIQYADDVLQPDVLRVSYNYGSVTELGGGPYDRSDAIPSNESGTFLAIVGSEDFPTLESAVAEWNVQKPGTAGRIVLPDYEAYDVDLTGAHAIRIAPRSTLLIASAEISPDGGYLFTESCVTLTGTIEIFGEAEDVSDQVTEQQGEVYINGVWFRGSLIVSGSPFCLNLSDATLVPGQVLLHSGEPSFPDHPSISGSALGATVCLTRTFTGPICLSPMSNVRLTSCIVDASSPYCVAITGPDTASAGPVLHVEDATIIGKVWTQWLRFASNTIFVSALGRHDPWKAAVWSRRRQSGCVRFCSLPWASLTPRQYECVPTSASNQWALAPQFVTLRFGDPAYGLLSGDCPIAIWKGADNGSQIGAYLSTQETEAVTNIQIRSSEYLPANLERGVFLMPSRAITEPRFHDQGSSMTRPPCMTENEYMEDVPIGIGIHLI